MSKQITGAEAMVRCLKAEGADIVFGYPGAAIVPFYDALAQSGIRHVLAAAEQGAGHMASGWARMTGRPGVCVATSGPGATNLFTAIATAYSDSIPMVVITGQVATQLLGRDVFQEVDTTGAAEPFTKYAYLVKSAAELPRVFKEAFYIASTGRRGPVLIDVPVDVQEQLVEFRYPESVNIRGYKPRTDGHALQVKRVAEAIQTASRPLVCCGGGVFLAGACPAVRRLCEESRLPLVSTMMGIGVLPPGHALYFGMLGKTGTEAANTAVRESDLLVLIGARAGDRAIANPEQLGNGARIVHIDIDTAEIGKNMGTTIPLVGDAARVAEQLLEKRPRGEWQAWLERLEALRAAERPRPGPEAPGTVDPNEFVRRLCRQLPKDAVYVADVGQNQIWSARNYSGEGRFLTAGGMGTMGYSIPAAIGAKLACPTQTVAAVLGDGAFQMCMNELAAMRRAGAPLKLVVVRNGTLGLVREIQEHGCRGREFAVKLDGAPDIGLIAAAYGVRHRLLDKIEEADAVISEMLSDDGPFLLECAVAEKEGSL